jgi:hypothetical protein
MGDSAARGHDRVRVGTWNLDHATTVRHDRLRIAALVDADADVWVLTETDDRLTPGAAFQPAHAASRPACPVGERWVSLWSRFPISEVLDVEDPLRTVAAVLDAPTGRLLVIGVVLPWHADRGDDPTDPPQRNWAEHRRVIPQRIAEWRRLAAAHADAALVIAGDFNTDLMAGTGAPQRTYGTQAEAALLRQMLTDLGMAVPTRGQTHPTDGGYLIDHIAVDGEQAGAPRVSVPEVNGRPLSDHPLVSVAFCRTR